MASRSLPVRSCRSNPSKPSKQIKKAKTVRFEVPAARVESDLEQYLDLFKQSQEQFDQARSFREKSKGKLLMQRKMMMETAATKARVRNLANTMPANLLMEVIEQLPDGEERCKMEGILHARLELDRQHDSPELGIWDDELAACGLMFMNVEIDVAAGK